MKNILELVSVLSLLTGLGQLVGVSGWVPTTQNVWQGLFVIPGIMEDIMELVSVLSLLIGLGQLVGVSGRGTSPPKMSGKVNS